VTFVKKLMKRDGRPEERVTDGLKSCGAALRGVEARDRQALDGWENNRAETPHLPVRRQERAMLRFRRMHSLQTLASVHSSVHYHLNTERRLSSRDVYKLNRTAALNRWRTLCAG
jgi:putative transposase